MSDLAHAWQGYEFTRPRLSADLHRQAQESSFGPLGEARTASAHDCTTVYGPSLVGATHGLSSLSRVPLQSYPARHAIERSAQHPLSSICLIQRI